MDQKEDLKNLKNNSYLVLSCCVGCVVCFNQGLGAAHSIHWLKSYFSHHSHAFARYWIKIEAKLKKNEAKRPFWDLLPIPGPMKMLVSHPKKLGENRLFRYKKSLKKLFNYLYSYPLITRKKSYFSLVTRNPVTTFSYKKTKRARKAILITN